MLLQYVKNEALSDSYEELRLDTETAPSVTWVK